MSWSALGFMKGHHCPPMTLLMLEISWGLSCLWWGSASLRLTLGKSQSSEQLVIVDESSKWLKQQETYKRREEERSFYVMGGCDVTGCEWPRCHVWSGQKSNHISHHTSELGAHSTTLIYCLSHISAAVHMFCRIGTRGKLCFGTFQCCTTRFVLIEIENPTKG